MQFLEIDAYNLWPGAAIIRGEKVLIIISVARDMPTEIVSFRARRGDDPGDDTLYLSAFDFNDQVRVVGNVVEYEDQSDNNWGAR